MRLANILHGANCRESVLEELQNISAQVDDIAARQENHGRTQSDLMGERPSFLPCPLRVLRLAVSGMQASAVKLGTRNENPFKLEPAWKVDSSPY